MELNLPARLAARLDGYVCEQNIIGMSTASVYKFQKNSEILFLKIDKNFNKIAQERDILIWLKNKLPVPEVIYYEVIDQIAYLLETAMPGIMSCEENIDEETVRILAAGLSLIGSLDISDCPFDHCLDRALKEALYNIQNDLVDMEGFETDASYKTPMELYDWLCQNRMDENPCFAHGDYCLPNVLIHDGKCGFIDNGNAGVADKWKDIAMCVRSLGYNLYLQKQENRKNRLVAYLFECLDIEPDWRKIDYYIKLDELF